VPERLPRSVPTCFHVPLSFVFLSPRTCSSDKITRSLMEKAPLRRFHVLLREMRKPSPIIYYLLAPKDFHTCALREQPSRRSFLSISLTPLCSAPLLVTGARSNKPAQCSPTSSAQACSSQPFLPSQPHSQTALRPRLSPASVPQEPTITPAQRT